MRSAAQLPRCSCPCGRIATATAEDHGTADRDDRADQRTSHVHHTQSALQSPLTRAGPNERAGFIEVSLTGAAHSPARAM
jgi:hypothetical protein